MTTPKGALANIRNHSESSRSLATREVACFRVVPEIEVPLAARLQVSFSVDKPSPSLPRRDSLIFTYAVLPAEPKCACPRLSFGVKNYCRIGLHTWCFLGSTRCTSDPTAVGPHQGPGTYLAREPVALTRSLSYVRVEFPDGKRKRKRIALWSRSNAPNTRVHIMRVHIMRSPFALCVVRKAQDAPADCRI